MFSQGHIDESAFRRLFDQYRERVYHYTLVVSHSTYLAEEITQEIFMKLWLCRDRLSEVQHMDSYIFSMARHKLLNHLRKAGNDARMLAEIQGSMTAFVNDVEERVSATDCEKALQEVLPTLSPRRRMVYQLSRNEGLNHREIADHLRLSQNTVKNHLVEALKTIRKHVVGSGMVAFLWAHFCR